MDNIQIFDVDVDGITYQVLPFYEDEHLAYEIKKINYTLFIMRSIDATWQADNDAEPDLVKKLGDIIEKYNL